MSHRAGLGARTFADHDEANIEKELEYYSSNKRFRSDDTTGGSWRDQKGDGDGDGDGNDDQDDDERQRVAEHYNKRVDGKITDRKESSILHLRNCNNFIKSVLLNQCLYEYRKDGASVLDLAGGKGGDLFKYVKHNVKHYVLADIAESSVRDAVERYNKLPQWHQYYQQKQQRHKQQQQQQQQQQQRGIDQKSSIFPAIFLAGDLTACRLHYVLDPEIRFDAVSCQFAFHYCFRNESMARRMLQNISDRLKIGGTFCATIPDARVLVSKLRQQLKSHHGAMNTSGNSDASSLNNNKDSRSSNNEPVTPGSIATTASSSSTLNSFGDDRNPWSFGNSCYRITFDPRPLNNEYSNKNKNNNNNNSKTTIKTSEDSSMDDGKDSNTESKNTTGDNNTTTTVDDSDDLTNDSNISFLSSSPFGIRYTFFLADAVDNVPEFLVHFPTLVALCREFGLVPILHENFASFFMNRMRDTSHGQNNWELLLKMMKVGGGGGGGDRGDRNDRGGRGGRDNYGTSMNRSRDNDPGVSDILGGKNSSWDDQWEAARLYCVIAFKKVSEGSYHGHSYCEQSSTPISSPTASTSSSSSSSSSGTGNLDPSSSSSSSSPSWLDAISLKRMSDPCGPGCISHKPPEAYKAMHIRKAGHLGYQKVSPYPKKVRQEEVIVMGKESWI